MKRDEIRYLEDLARQIEAAARVTPNRAKLMTIAANIRKYKEKKDENLAIELGEVQEGEQFEFIEA